MARLADKVEHTKRLVRLEKMMLRGITNQTELAAAFGIARTTLREWMKEIHTDWLDAETNDAKLDRVARKRQIEGIAQQALNAWERSKQDAETVTITHAICPSCQGKKETGPKDDKTPCVTCNATGRVLQETTKIEGQAGDPSFLRLAKECFVECARLEGAYPENKGRIAALVGAAQAVGGEAQEKIEAYYLELPADTLIKAMAALEEMQEWKKEHEVRNITTTVTKPLEIKDQPDDGRSEDQPSSEDSGGPVPPQGH